MRKTLSVLPLLLLLSYWTHGQYDQKVENVAAFTKLYGYVRYFHPSDEAAVINWGRFAIYGSKQVENCKNRQELKETLNSLFHPFAPTLQVMLTEEKRSFDVSSITPPFPKAYKVIAWQHSGLGSGRKNDYYNSARTNRPQMYWEFKNRQRVDTIHPPMLLFDHHPTVGEYIAKEIGGGVKIIMPLALYGNETETYPLADKAALDNLQIALNAITEDELKGTNLYTRLGNIVVSWNVFQHFYPYFDVANTNWHEDLKAALKRAYTDQTEIDFERNLKLLTASLKDGHIRVGWHQSQEKYQPPIRWEWIENKLLITQVGDSSSAVKVGDIVTEIDGKSPEDFFSEVNKYISAPTKGWLDYRARWESLLGPKDSEIQLGLLRSDNSTVVTRLLRTQNSREGMDFLPEKPGIMQAAKNVMYINLDKASMADINKAMPLLQKSKAIICDLRGYPKGNVDLLEYLLPINDTSTQWMQVPQITYPDQEKILSYRKSSWQLVAKQPRLKAKVIFITDGRAISAAEGYLSYVEHYKLATIVGQNTAGTNGSFNVFVMNGNYGISWTGTKVQKLNNTQFHGIGIRPHVHVEKTIKGVRANRDEFLEKALQVAGVSVN